ncbi:MAG: M23 family metallopeptidase [Chloroflexi bacterium]|nr:M23 family metallopeptidase [Chloroflexota bacterium]MCY3582562.1 M23 family metallopeptidase [Chloroflexota bacterium]MCY3717910.1 M23 family metallopeptidase [Chloroflexota bacterium]MDE2649120.1 M23 family metallopeptidase [Chloroflexota bacterium]
MSRPQPQPAPRPIPLSGQFAVGVQLDWHFASLSQGELGLLCLLGGGIRSAQVYWLGEIVPFFRAEGGWYALLAAGMETLPRQVPLVARAQLETGAATFARRVRIMPGMFLREEFTLQGAAAGLVDADIEAAEMAAIAEMTARTSSAPLWDAAGFALPLPSAFASPFGSFRAMNASLRTRHTGWDQHAATGTPVRAMAAGRVAFAGQLAIRGSYALIDHGLGLYTGYAHFSALQVQAGQTVAAGQVIGLSGNTGRSSAPHLHWELRWRGRWVNGLALLEMWLPQTDSG